MNFGQRIKHYRDAAKMSQTTLAKLSGIKQATISQLETGANATSKHIFKIAIALNVSPHLLDPHIPEAIGIIPDAVKPFLSGLNEMTESEQRDFMLSLEISLSTIKQKRTWPLKK
jgi:transcriptional regulator with XRE-family HTH domain